MAIYYWFLLVNYFISNVTGYRRQNKRFFKIFGLFYFSLIDTCKFLLFRDFVIN